MEYRGRGVDSVDMSLEDMEELMIEKIVSLFSDGVPIVDFAIEASM